MRIHEGDYAYEVRQMRDPLTQLTKSWQYVVYRIRPVDQVLERGDLETREDAEKRAKMRLSQFLKTEKESRVA